MGASLLALAKSIYYLLQNDFSSYSIDRDGPVPAPSPDSVEVPETRCPINPKWIESMSPFYPPAPAPKMHQSVMLLNYLAMLLNTLISY